MQQIVRQVYSNMYQYMYMRLHVRLNMCTVSDRCGSVEMTTCVRARRSVYPSRYSCIRSFHRLPSVAFVILDHGSHEEGPPTATGWTPGAEAYQKLSCSQRPASGAREDLEFHRCRQRNTWTAPNRNGQRRIWIAPSRSSRRPI